MVRCAGSSLAAVAVEFGLLSLLVSLFHVFYLAGALIAGAVSLVIAFVLNRRWAFADGRDDAASDRFVKHVVVVGGGIALATVLLWLGVSRLSLPYQVGWIASGTIVFSRGPSRCSATSRSASRPRSLDALIRRGDDSAGDRRKTERRHCRGRALRRRVVAVRAIAALRLRRV